MNINEIMYFNRTSQTQYGFDIVFFSLVFLLELLNLPGNPQSVGMLICVHLIPYQEISEVPPPLYRSPRPFEVWLLREGGKGGVRSLPCLIWFGSMEQRETYGL